MLATDQEVVRRRERWRRSIGESSLQFDLSWLGYLFMNGTYHLRINGSLSMEDLPS